MVLFHKAARVQPLDIPKGTEISASLYDYTEDGPDINYWLDVSSLEVHQVSGITFQTESHSVHRHRFEKREPKF